jgi:CTP:phosphocholine cytidylyltransferase-like protein
MADQEILNKDKEHLIDIVLEAKLGSRFSALEKDIQEIKVEVGYLKDAFKSLRYVGILLFVGVSTEIILKLLQLIH